jgi:predicted alpha/beta-hydrolase family hydrolase
MTPTDFRIALHDEASVSARHYAAAADVREDARATLILAHGAGAGHLHPFIAACGAGLAERGVDIVTFNFPYMEARRRLPDRAPALERAYLAAIAETRQRVPAAARALLIGGKSMGGRMASHVAAHHAEAAGPIAGLVFLGYPLHPPGRHDRPRDVHLSLITSPMLFVQGERDAFGTPDELRPVLSRLSAPADLVVIDRGDHSFAVPRGTGRSPQQVLDHICGRVATWVREQAQEGEPPCASPDRS